MGRIGGMGTNRRAVLAGLGLLALPGAVRAAEPVQVAVSSTSFVIGGLKIGMQTGVFARHGLDLHLTVMDSGNAAMGAMIGGSVPFCITGPPEVLAARLRGQDCVIAANLYAGFAGLVVLGKAAASRLGVAPTAPVAERLHALDGLVLAVPSATSSLLGPVREAAARQGAKVRFTYMAQGAMPAAVESEAVAGLVASYPFAGVPILRGTGIAWINGPGGELPADLASASSSALDTTQRVAATNMPLVRRMQDGLVDTARFIQADQAGARAALAASYPQLSSAEIDLAFEQQWRNWTKPFLSVDDIRQEIRLLQGSITAPSLGQMDPAAVLIPPA